MARERARVRARVRVRVRVRARVRVSAWELVSALGQCSTPMLAIIRDEHIAPTILVSE